MVKSARVVADRERPEALSPEWKSKVERYVVYWRKKYSGSWPVNAAAGSGSKSAAWLERTRDRLRYARLRASDSLIPFVYSFIPVSLWQRYRRMKYRNREFPIQAVSKVQQSFPEDLVVKQ